MVEPKGLDAKWQWYTYAKQTRQFCHEGKDITWPLPLCAKSTSSTVPPSPLTRNSPAHPLMSHQSSDQPLSGNVVTQVTTVAPVVRYNIYSTITYPSSLPHTPLHSFPSFCCIPHTLTLQLSLLHYHHPLLNVHIFYYFTHCMPIDCYSTNTLQLAVFFLHVPHCTAVPLYI